MVATPIEAALQALKANIVGRVITPHDVDYDMARRTWNLRINQYPSVILIAENAEDVIYGVRFARDVGLNIAVQATGHGHKHPADDCLLVITSQLNTVEIDIENRIARVGAGVQWKQVVKEAVPHGLAPLLGSAPHVGVVGYTLGGGIGWLARRFGLAVDSVVSLDVVTADGVLHHTSADENADLFWAVQSGGGNFGIVTAISFYLYPVATLYGGGIVYPQALATEALKFYRQWINTIPDNLTSSLTIFKYPSIPQIPAALHGKIDVMIRAAYVAEEGGDASEGAAWMQPWLDWQTPSQNTFHVMPFSEIGTISRDPVAPSAGFASNELLHEISDELIELTIQHFTAKDSALNMVEFRHAGGAITRGNGNNAIEHRDALIYMQMGSPVPTPEIYQAVSAQVAQLRAALKPYVSGGVFLNFTSGSDTATRTKFAYSAQTLARLQALKAQYDPQNVFRFGNTIIE